MIMSIKQRKIKIEPRIKLNHNIQYVAFDHFTSYLNSNDFGRLFRYALSTQHGIGVPSLMVILHEILKLLYYAEAQDVKFFRIGTSGGLGIHQIIIIQLSFITIKVCKSH